MKTAELQQAFTWICDDCGKRNYVKCVTDESVMNLEEGEVQVLIPTVVECKHCKVKFEADIEG